MNVKKFIWDYKVTGDNLEELAKDPEFVARVLSFGDDKEMRELLNVMGRDKIAGFLRQRGYKLDKRSFNYWKLYFGLPDDFVQPKRIFDDACCWKPF